MVKVSLEEQSDFEEEKDRQLETALVRGLLVIALF
jgi:hypothetical protein